MPHHGKVLEELYKRYDSSAQEFSALLEITQSSFYNLLKKETFTKAMIALLCTLFEELSPQSFGKGADFFTNDLTSIADKSFSIRGDFISLNDFASQRDQRRAFIEAYFTTLREHVSKIEDVFHWYEYIPLLDTVSNGNTEDFFQQEYSKFKMDTLRLFHSHSQGKTAKFFQLIVAIDTKLPLDRTKDFFQQLSNPVYTPVHSFIDWASPTYLNYIWGCFTLFGGTFRMYVTDAPPRRYSYMVIDENTFIRFDNWYGLTEKYLVDTLDVHHASEPHKSDKRVQLRLNEFSRLMNGSVGKAVEVNEALFRDAVYDVYAEKQKAYERKAEEIKNLEEELNKVDDRLSDEFINLERQYFQVVATSGIMKKEIEASKEKVSIVSKKEERIESISLEEIFSHKPVFVHPTLGLG